MKEKKEGKREFTCFGNINMVLMPIKPLNSIQMIEGKDQGKESQKERE